MGQLGRVRWCWFVDEVARVDGLDNAPSLMTTVTCEDILLMRISLDTLAGGAARFTAIRGFARDYLGITSHRVLYRMLRRLCEYGLVKFRRGSTCRSSDYDCAVSKTGCRIMSILPTSIGLVLASTTSLAFFTYLDMYTKYVSNELSGEASDAMNLVKESIINLFNLGAYDTYDKTLARSMHQAAMSTFMSMKNITELMAIADAIGLDTPESTYAFRAVVFHKYNVNKFLRFVLVGLIHKALRYGFNINEVSGLIKDLLNDRVDEVRKHLDLVIKLAKASRQEGVSLLERLMQ
ncbi:hypothetical protein [Vulcanisaeta distributa]|uniref:Uncharacterized protein n=1 Tax=Vulcanisaeta distributa (strain DSM 14429 / JCM 11212 / NBRC 100878 / IC-017) TaxID=572478 RepID=E1QSQ7_VULDI|nr:hypothetical protein [Vulcanisaeta distributa]ADN49574.1 hypothetical protein Vdis_0161 [Vulcanisaeta distributa DSM 14429]